MKRIEYIIADLKVNGYKIGGYMSKDEYNKNTLKYTTHTGHKLTLREHTFIHKFIELGNARQAGLQAGYSAKCIDQTINKMLHKTYLADEIKYLQAERQKESIATGQEVMEFFTKVMNGEVKDQFGLESTLADRLKAANELARRTVDIENKLNGKDEQTIKFIIERRKSE